MLSIYPGVCGFSVLLFIRSCHFPFFSVEFLVLVPGGVFSFHARVFLLVLCNICPFMVVMPLLDYIFTRAPKVSLQAEMTGYSPATKA